jgi:hypothetical protein
VHRLWTRSASQIVASMTLALSAGLTGAAVSLSTSFFAASMRQRVSADGDRIVEYRNSVADIFERAAASSRCQATVGIGGSFAGGTGLPEGAATGGLY